MIQHIQITSTKGTSAMTVFMRLGRKMAVAHTSNPPALLPEIRPQNHKHQYKHTNKNTQQCIHKSQHRKAIYLFVFPILPRIASSEVSVYFFSMRYSQHAIKS